MTEPIVAEVEIPLTSADMQMSFAAQFASEIGAVITDGGEALLRERVGALEEGQRMLRAALDR